MLCTSAFQTELIGGSRGGGAGGPDPPPLKNRKIRVSMQYWSGSPEKSQSYQASIQCWAIIAKLLAFQGRAEDGPLIVVF